MNSRKLLGFILLLCGGFLLFAFYLQHYQYISPCPLCVLQRYAYIAIVVFCAAGRWTSFVRFFSFLSLLAAAGGAYAAWIQMGVMKTPAVQCGRDPLEATVNSLITAKWMPSFFRADGYCSDPLDRIIGLTLPEWSIAWLMVFAFVFLVILLRRPG